MNLIDREKEQLKALINDLFKKYGRPFTDGGPSCSEKTKSK